MLEDLIEEALKHISRKSREFSIRVSMEDEMQLVNVDSRLILQVIINIVDNAVKYTPPGGEIVISTKKKVLYMCRLQIMEREFRMKINRIFLKCFIRQIMK